MAVLIIESDKDLADSIRLYLEDSYRVFIKKDPAQISNYIAKHDIQLVLTDIDISTQDKENQLTNLKSSHPEIKIILMYMFLDEDEVREQSMFKNADDYILKPFDAGVLKQKCDRLLALKPSNLV